MEIAIADVKIREDRHRKAFTNINELAASIKENGQLQPIIIDHDNYLIAGERRLRACISLGMEMIWAARREDLIDSFLKEVVELEENLQRENLTWPEEVAAKGRLHQLYCEKYGYPQDGSHQSPWSIRKTAEMLGRGQGNVTEDLALAKAIIDDPSLKTVGSKTKAIKQMKMKKERGLRTLLADVLMECAIESKEELVRVICGDSREVLGKFDEESFDFCVTDPPWGIGFDSNMRSDRSWKDNIFDDTNIGQEIEEVFGEVYRVLRTGAHCYVVFGFGGLDKIAYVDMLGMLERIGFRVVRRPLIWYKRGGNAIGNDTNYDYDPSYEAIFYASKGSPRPLSTQRVKDVFECLPPSRGEKSHPAEKPTELFRWLIGNCSLPGELGVDPFMGAGTFPIACKESGRRGVGIEKDKVWYFEAVQKMEKGKEKE